MLKVYFLKTFPENRNNYSQLFYEFKIQCYFIIYGFRKYSFYETKYFKCVFSIILNYFPRGLNPMKIYKNECINILNE